MYKIFLVAILILLASGCQKNLLVSGKSYMPLSSAESYQLTAVDSLVADGNFELKLSNRVGKLANVSIAKHPGCNTSVSNHTLYISGNCNHLLTIKANNFKNLTLAGNVKLSTKDFNSKGLSITTKDNASVMIDGQVSLAELNQLGSGKIEISWVDSNKITITASGSGPIFLSGITNFLAIKLTGKASLFAKYLRAQDIQIFAADNSAAEILAIDKLTAFASQKSNIGYYKKPQKATVVTKDAGNILIIECIA